MQGNLLGCASPLLLFEMVLVIAARAVGSCGGRASLKPDMVARVSSALIS